MTSAASVLPDLPAPTSSPAPVSASVEFLIVGGATLLLLPLLWLIRTVVGLGSAELAVGFLTFHAAHVINDPHFAVTYLLFYKNARQRGFGQAFAPWHRARYLFAGVFVPVALTSWLVMAFAGDAARLLGALIQLMFLLVGWHYVKQGFGVLSVLSARRGVRFSVFERRVLLSHCFAGWAYAWASPAVPALESEEKGVIYFAAPHPALLEHLTLLVFALSAVALAAMLGRKWLRERRLPPLGPLTGFLVSIWVWTVFSSADPLLVYVIPALHSLQYLYFVWLLTKNQAQTREAPPYFGPPVRQRLAWLAVSAVALGWLLFHAAPDVLDGARLAVHRSARIRLGDLGATPYFAAFFVFVNVHHYFMDNVIWRRENPDTSYLLG